jgi:hypothetical protein
MQATPPRSAGLAALARALKGAEEFAARPFGYENPPMALLSELLGLPAVQRTVERAAYGEPLTTGRGWTTKMRPDTAEAAMATAPMLPGATRGALGAVKRATDLEAIRDYVRSAQGVSGLPGAAAVKPERDWWTDYLRRTLDKAPTQPSREAEMLSLEEALAKTDRKAAEAAAARQKDRFATPGSYESADWPETFYRAIRSTGGPSEISSLLMPGRGPDVLIKNPNSPRGTAWAASNPLTASSFAKEPESVVVPLRLLQKPDVVFNAKGAPWLSFFSQTGQYGRGTYNYPLNEELKSMIRDPSVRSILVKDIFDSGLDLRKELDVLGDLYGVSLKPENMLSDNLLIKDPSVVQYKVSGETPLMVDKPKAKKPEGKARGGVVTAPPGPAQYDPLAIDSLAEQLLMEA